VHIHAIEVRSRAAQIRACFSQISLVLDLLCDVAGSHDDDHKWDKRESHACLARMLPLSPRSDTHCMGTAWPCSPHPSFAQWDSIIVRVGAHAASGHITTTALPLHRMCVLLAHVPLAAWPCMFSLFTHAVYGSHRLHGRADAHTACDHTMLVPACCVPTFHHWPPFTHSHAHYNSLATIARSTRGPSPRQRASAHAARRARAT
jgi:hypothetical protein